MSFFSGKICDSPDLTFNNEIEQITYMESANQNGYYSPYIKEFTVDSAYTTITPQDDRIKYANVIRPDLAGGKVGIWAGSSGENGQWDAADIKSEFVEYYLEEDNCLSDPVHVLFLNRQGVFDTYTFDRKALEEKKINRKTYAMGGIADKPMFTQLSTERRNVVYNQDIVVEMNVDSWYLSDNDKPIIMDLFQSPEVYIIKDHDWSGQHEKSYNPYLIPVTINSDSITEFKNMYSKIFQYNFTFEYTPINYYRTQG